eukprot:CAMPEP_0118994132 /NCGR_PEP_ID=MMETSP1173-20130426/56305_1 /TAXON_ID=1034831 /ORGANISM="Rhizochromulina marina cf, Strain CCMP1243" /LENGTH=46 /DNA_ID= /DNA_START= /DNA_END= /DNA_ORIENTATION=
MSSVEREHGVLNPLELPSRVEFPAAAGSLSPAATATTPSVSPTLIM